MDITQIKSITACAVNQLLGDDYYSTGDDNISTSEYIEALDSGKLVDVGKTVENFTNGLDQFAKACIDQLSKIYVESREYVEELPDIYIDSEEWGGFVESIQFDLNKSINDDIMWNLQDGTSYATEEHTFYQPKCNVKIFGERKAITVPYSIATKQMRTSFKSWSEMDTFLSGLDVWVRNTIKVCYEAYGKALLGLSCGLSISSDSGALNNAIHLLTEYNTKFNETLTPETAIDDKDFLIYACKRIKKVRRLLSRMGTQFNDGSVNTFTPEYDKRLVLLGDFVDSVKFNVKASTYNSEDIALGDYKEISTWQGVKLLEPSEFSFTITTKAYTGDTIKINGLSLVAGTDFSLSTDTATGNATAIVSALNSSTDTKVSGFTWSSDGATIKAVTDEDHYTEKVKVEVTQVSSGTLVVSKVTTDYDGNTTNDLKDLSTISIKTNAKLPFTSNFTKKYVIGLMYDYRGIGMSFDEQFATTSYTGVGSFTNIFNHICVNYVINSGYNMCAFVLD